MLKTFEVNNVRCEGCANTIRKALDKEGFSNIEIDLACEPRKVSIDITAEASLAQFRTILRNLGYPLLDEEVSYIDSTTLKAKSIVSCAIGKFSDNKKKN